MNMVRYINRLLGYTLQFT